MPDDVPKEQTEPSTGRTAITVQQVLAVMAFAILLVVCLGLIAKEQSSRKAMTKMEAARNSDTSNFDNVLKF